MFHVWWWRQDNHHQQMTLNVHFTILLPRVSRWILNNFSPLAVCLHVASLCSDHNEFRDTNLRHASNSAMDQSHQLLISDRTKDHQIGRLCNSFVIAIHPIRSMIPEWKFFPDVSNVKWYLTSTKATEKATPKFGMFQINTLPRLLSSSHFEQLQD